MICGFGWKFIGEKAAIVDGDRACLFLCADLQLDRLLSPLTDRPNRFELLRWIESGTLTTDWAIRLDRLTAIMLIVVTTVSALVHLYSALAIWITTRNGARARVYKPRFFAYLSFFTFAMLMLVTSDNLVQMFFRLGRRGRRILPADRVLLSQTVGQCGGDESVHRQPCGRFRLCALGIFALFFLVDSMATLTTSLPAGAHSWPKPQLTFLWDDRGTPQIEVCLSCSSSGQWGNRRSLILHTWLAGRDGGPDACIGADPRCNHGDSWCLSGLPHVAADGVCAWSRSHGPLSPSWERRPPFFAATVGLVQNDIKRVIAYSTCSQLGYMFVAAGVGMYSAAMFHLFTHAFFKAMLFLGAGSVIHAMHHKQDMRNYGNLRKKIPYIPLPR